MSAVLIALVAAVLAAGGMRSLTWSSVAKAITALLALAVPATIFALDGINLPLPQMTHGNTLAGPDADGDDAECPDPHRPTAGARPGRGWHGGVGQEVRAILRKRRPPSASCLHRWCWRPA